MPNWVFNTWDNYPEDIHEKYMNDDTDIDFNKVIPEPEEITNTVSGGYNNIAKNIYKYREYRNSLDIKNKQILNDALKYDSKNPLREDVKKVSDRTVTAMGELAIENPDYSLNHILSKKENEHSKNLYDNYVSIFGNNRYYKCKDFDKVYENYINIENKKFNALKEISNSSSSFYEKFSNLEEMGKHFTELQEKYGFDNWYDWRIANWGTKWNACESSYDPEAHSLRFDTAWSIPYPIASKLANDNPELKIDGYSEEENGWFDEYSTRDQKLYINARGEYRWDEDADENILDNRQELNPPEEYTYEDISKQSREDWAHAIKNINI